MLRKGKVFLWNSEKAYGFIEPIKGGKVIFAHVTSFGQRHPAPKVGEHVKYKLGKDPKGRPRALDIQYIDRNSKKSSSPASPKRWFGGLVVLPIYLSWILINHQSKTVLLLLIGWHLLLSLVTHSAYQKDKVAAQSNDWRVSENTLHFLSLIGGWPGAIIAQQSLRHKTKKLSFRITFWITVLLSLSFAVFINSNLTLDELPSLLNLGGIRSDIQWSDPR